jgi:hypothetical protein
MTDAPEKLWAEVHIRQGLRVTPTKPLAIVMETCEYKEYIRKDISDARIEVILMSLQMANTAWDQETSGRKAAGARIKQLEDALESISCMGFDMPATLDLTDEAWSKRRAGLMQQIAREALKENDK